MGLDNFFVKKLPVPDKDGNSFAVDDNFPKLNLVVGIFSGGPGAFRGKVYEDYVLDVTGESLHQSEIPPETVKEMAKKLEEALKQPEKHEANGHYLEDVKDLSRAFRYAADHDMLLVGWW